MLPKTGVRAIDDKIPEIKSIRKANAREKKLAERAKCVVPKCGHCPQAHVKHKWGKFMGERAQCNYSRCRCRGYVP